MKIANPIYDVVFKYLMDDNKIAKLMISKIIGEEIVELDFQPKENVASINISARDKTEEKPELSFTVYRLDFAAKIKTAKGTYKQVLIEIQKAKFSTDIMRFRKYLGSQYYSKKNVVAVEGKSRKTALPIITIYFLGHPLDFITAPVIKVNRSYTDLATGEQLTEKEEFIESLTHDSYVIQIPALKGKRRNELEKLLGIFDQSQMESNHILNVDENDFPEQYRDIIRKLQRAILEEDIKNTMDVEDEVLAELEEKERHIGDLMDSINEKDKEIERLRKLLDDK